MGKWFVKIDLQEHLLSSLQLSLSVSVCLSLFFSPLSLSLSLSCLSFWLMFSLAFSLAFCISLFLFLFLSLSVFVSFSLSLSLCFLLPQHLVSGSNPGPAQQSGAQAGRSQGFWDRPAAGVRLLHSSWRRWEGKRVRKATHTNTGKPFTRTLHSQCERPR